MPTSAVTHEKVIQKTAVTELNFCHAQQSTPPMTARLERCTGFTNLGSSI